MMKRSVAVWLAGACVAAMASGASAQNAPVAKAQDASSSDQTDNENIVITATKRPQVLLDVPQSISVVSGANLEAQHATNFQDYLKLVPGLQLNQDTPGEGRLIVRGVNTGGVASTVSVYVDDTPFGSSSGLVNGAVLAGDFDTFDLNRIELLRGPQGTLYGASSLSGVLRFITNAPSTTGIRGSSTGGHRGGQQRGPWVQRQCDGERPAEFLDCFSCFGQFPQGCRLYRLHGIGGSDHAKNINDDRVYGGRASLLFKPSQPVRHPAYGNRAEHRCGCANADRSRPGNLEPLHGLTDRSSFRILKPALSGVQRDRDV